MNGKTAKALIFVATCVFAAAPAICLAADANPPSVAQKTGEYIGDSALTTKVKAALLAEKDLKSVPISVESTDGVVTLSGKVVSSAQIDQAVDVAKNVSGVTDVHNAMTLKTDK